jgi:septal ring factor EnvC (AmiA/AmiB activator)
MDILVGLFAVMGGAILLLLNQNKKLKSDKKLSDLKAEDAKLEGSQTSVKEEKDKLKKELNAPVKQEELSDSQIEDFWKGYKDDK